MDGDCDKNKGEFFTPDEIIDFVSYLQEGTQYENTVGSSQFILSNPKFSFCLK